MKAIFPLLIILLGLTFESHSQTILTRSQVYDFDINDEFHSKVYPQPPNGRRMKVISKQFSSQNDTVFYVFNFDNYTSTPVMTPTPHLQYQFISYTLPRYYTNLDSSISDQFQNFPIIDPTDYFNDTLFYSTEYCGIYVYEYEGVSGSSFEPSYYSEQYGQGLGRTKYYFLTTVQPFFTINDEMFYFKKDTLQCGIPDTLDASMVSTVHDIVQLSNVVTLYPNPASTVISIDSRLNESFKISIYNTAGILVKRVNNVFNGQEIDISTLTKGFYFASIESDKNIYRKKIIIE